ncbi:hypothetical protein [Clostridium isatidis]|uniref:hypothetical protein n=1 Tax=Clostridium isatidis TaxID=182773 RepID=UPI003AADBD34
MKWNKVRITITIISVLFFLTCIVYKDNISKYIDYNKKIKNFNYTYNVDKELDVKGIIDKNNIIIQDEEKLIKYDLKRSKKDKIIAKINDGYDLKSLTASNEGVIWIETRVTPSISSKIYFKNYDSDEIRLIDESTDKILPDISLSGDNITYYIINDNKFEIKLVNIKSFKERMIKSYESSVNKGYISAPSINKDNIVWSYTNEEGSIVYIYNIDDTNITEMKTDEVIYNPVLKHNRLFAIKENLYYDKKINDSYSSNYIVELESKSNEWIKFESENIKNYIYEPKESIFRLAHNSNILYWLSSLRDGNCIYDSNNNKFIPLTKDNSKITTQILLAKENTIYYEFRTDEEVYKFILSI